MRTFLSVLVSLSVAGIVRADETKIDPADPKGKPTSYRAGLSARYVIWYDAGGWHLRVTTSSALSKFTGTIEPVGGKIVSMTLVSGRKGADLPPLKTQSKSIDLSNEIGKGIQSGYDFKLEDSATAIKFDLKINGKDVPTLIYIGSRVSHPKVSPFTLPAKAKE